MFFEIDRDLFFEGLSKTVPIAEKRSPLPILSHILIEVIDFSINLTSTDLEVALKITCDAVTKTPGILAVPSRKLFEIVRELPAGQIVIESIEANRIRISSGQSAFELSTLEAADYPLLPNFDNVSHTAMSAQKLLKMIDKTLFAASTDDSRFNLNGVLFETIEGKTRLVATDGHRLAFIEEDLGFITDSQHVVPKKGLQELKRLLESVKEDIEVGFEAKNLCVSCKRFLMSIRLVDGDYPDYRKVVPQNSSKVLKITRVNFSHALRRTAVLTSDRNKGVTVEISSGKMVFTVTHPDLGSARDVLTVDYLGEECVVIINVFYLLEAIGTVDSELISIEFEGEGSPVIIKPDPPSSYFNLVMPMRK